jgi:hypothetical protein
MMPQQPRRLGCLRRWIFLIGILFCLVGLVINVAWFLYLKPNGIQPLLLFYICNLLPGLFLFLITTLIPDQSHKRWQYFGAIGLGSLGLAISLVWLVVLNIFMVAGIALFYSPANEPTSRNTPEEMFKYIIRDPIPLSIKHLEGVGDTWQGYSIYLRFQASDVDINALIAAGYKPVKCQIIADHFVLPTGYDRFKPSWNPKLSSDRVCYEDNEVKNSWTHSGAHYLLIDRKSRTVYFSGIGA